jgi:hypothetical protein
VIGDASPHNRGSWEIEGHAGGGLGNNPSGDALLPAVGAPFVTFNGLPSHTVASWYFGDGTELFNQLASERGMVPRLSALGSALSTSSITSRRSGTFGVRIGRSMTNRLTAEFSLDFATRTTALSDAARTMIEASHTSFPPAFEALLAEQAAHIASSTSDIDETTGGRIAATGAIRINLFPDLRSAPYVTLGGGVASPTGDPATVRLSGNYQFTSASNTLYRQTDTVVFRFTSGPVPVVVVGGGFTRPLSDRSGLRIDARIQAGSNDMKVVVSTSPQTTLGGAATFVFGGPPAIQISSGGTRTSTLSEVLLSDKVATGRGIRTNASGTVGYYWRLPAREKKSADAAQSAHTSVRRMTALGALIGAGAGTILMLASPDCTQPGGFCGAYVAMGAGVGAGIGAGVGAIVGLVRQ